MNEKAQAELVDGLLAEFEVEGRPDMQEMLEKAIAAAYSAGYISGRTDPAAYSEKEEEIQFERLVNFKAPTLGGEVVR